MASDGVPVKALVTNPVQASQAPVATAHQPSGKSLPASGNLTAAKPNQASSPVKPFPAKPAADLPALVAQLNKHLQSSGRPTQYRLASSPGGQVIQELNPDTNQVVGEIPASEFKALAQELGISGLLVDARA
ncbi:MAG TPA: flagellar protein FlaG [Steroidobacteraceae bacterium]|nr:flagellar protein FlaG [Steroidobacteraceae bacterium]